MSGMPVDQAIVIGIYHPMREAHLGRYCRDLDLRYNTPAP
jgi:hypothetical protein